MGDLAQASGNFRAAGSALGETMGLLAHYL
jgi:hypothetical protein